MNHQKLKKYERLKEAARRAGAALKAYEDEIAQGCDHPAEYIGDYTYEHDNGYGHQSKSVGQICGICKARNPYPSLSSRWIAEADYYRSRANEYDY